MRSWRRKEQGRHAWSRTSFLLVPGTANTTKSASAKPVRRKRQRKLLQSFSPHFYLLLPICSSLLSSKHTCSMAGQCSECQSCSEHSPAQTSPAHPHPAQHSPEAGAGRSSLTNTAAARWQTHSPNETLRTVTGSPRAVKSREPKANRAGKKKQETKNTEKHSSLLYQVQFLRVFLSHHHAARG